MQPHLHTGRSITRSSGVDVGSPALHSLAAAARLIRNAYAGVALWVNGTAERLPGLSSHLLLEPASPLVAVAHDRAHRGQVYTSFLWPIGGRHAPDGHVRVTVLGAPDDAAAHLLGAIVLSFEDDLRGLTPRELEVLGLLVDGCSNQQIAHKLVVAVRTVAAHLEHILFKLEASTRTLAAVRAERAGLYVPALWAPCRS